MSIADRIAGALGARKAGGWWRTSTAHCHGGDNTAGLAFRSPDDDPEKLIVYCHTRACHKTAEGRNRAPRQPARRGRPCPLAALTDARRRWSSPGQPKTA